MKTEVKRILIVDDSRIDRRILKQRLLSAGYGAEEAKNGKQALEIMKSTRIQLAIVDQRMPDMDGLEVITQLKKIDPSIKTMLLTGHGDEKLKEATEALNSAYFEKEDMGSFWGFFRKILKSLETSMAAAGMAEDGDQEDAIKIEDPLKKDK